MSLTNDQETRIRCLQLCAGSVSEAKQAYYWVMGEQNQAKQQTSGLQIGPSAQQVREADAQRKLTQAADEEDPRRRLAASRQVQNTQFGRNPNIGNGSGD